MVNLVVISKNLEDAREELYSRFLYNHSIDIDCSSMEVNTFISKNFHTLYRINRNHQVFLGVEVYKDDILLDLLLYKDLIPSVWIFKSLPKNRKLYKKFKELNIPIEEIDPLSSPKVKKDFIKKLLLKYTMDLTYLDLLVNILPEDRSIINREVEKFFYLLQQGSSFDFCLEALNEYEGSKDLLTLSDDIFKNKLSDNYRLAVKVCNSSPPLVIYSVLNRKLKFMILLSCGHQMKALALWNYPRYLLPEVERISKKIGFNNLIEVHGDLIDNMSNPINSRNPFISIHNLIIKLYNTI